MKSGIRSALRQLVLPNGLLLAAAALLLPWKLGAVFAPPGGRFIGLVIAASGVLLAWRLRTPRLMLMLFLLLASEGAWMLIWTWGEPGLRNILAILLPLNVAALLLVDDGFVDWEAFAWWGGLIGVQAAGITLVIGTGGAALFRGLGRPLIPHLIPGSRIPQLSTLLFLLCGAGMLVAFLMHRKYRPWNADQYAGWYGYHEFSRGPHTGFMAHFIDLVHFVTGARYPKRVVALGGTYRWKDARTAPDSIEVVLEYPDSGFLARYNTTFGTNANSYLKFIGTRGVMDATVWNKPWVLGGAGSGEADRIAEGTRISEVDSTPHMTNWFECLRSRKRPNATIDDGYNHSVACIMADEAYIRGKRMAYDPARRRIYEG